MFHHKYIHTHTHKEKHSNTGSLTERLKGDQSTVFTHSNAGSNTVQGPETMTTPTERSESMNKWEPVSAGGSSAGRSEAQP